MTFGELARYIDHTNLKPEATESEISELCSEAVEYKFASVCVNPTFVKNCKTLLLNSEVKVCTVVGFPLGAGKTEVKVFEAEQAIRDGAEEIDMVINIGKLKSGDDQNVEDEIRQIVTVCKSNNAICKVIIETALLTEEEKIKACKLSIKAKADYVKTSTGFSKAGATSNDVKLIRSVVGDATGVKAAGGIRTLEDAVKMIESGASRIGTSAGVSIMKELIGKENN